MSKALNAFIEKSVENDTRVTKLSIIDFNHPSGVREKVAVKTKTRDPQVKVVTKVREVTYLYNKKTTKGWEIVEEVPVSRSKIDDMFIEPDVEVVGRVTHDLRKAEKPTFNKREEDEQDSNW